MRICVCVCACVQVEDAVNMVLDALKLRHGPEWVAELQLHDVPQSRWLAHLFGLVGRITEAARVAMDEDAALLEGVQVASPDQLMDAQGAVNAVSFSRPVGIAHDDEE